ncbi:MAG: histidine phosphatase family protein [Patescibacteria group bacterium]
MAYAWKVDQGLTQFPGGESYKDVQKRAWSAVCEILKQTHQETIVICTHVDVIKMIIFKAGNIPISSKPFFVVDSGSICNLLVSGDIIKIPFGKFT